MNSKEKYLYHQIHPLKLFTDIGAAFGSLCLLWRHQLALALVVMLAPPLLISFLLMRYADLERYRQSAFGKYIARSMSHAMEAVRLAGMAVTALGAWHQSLWIILAGVAIVLFGWLRGKISNA
jgi:ABC-type bacteriocin/lantibiotic exporter with double-glycine peptidase domain